MLRAGVLSAREEALRRTVVAGARETRRQIAIYSVVLLASGVAPWIMGYAGTAYGVTALVAGSVMVALSARLWREGAGERGPRAARQLFAFSILYLFVLFAVLLIEAGLRVGA